MQCSRRLLQCPSQWTGWLSRRHWSLYLSLTWESGCVAWIKNTAFPHTSWECADSEPSVSMQPHARTCPVANKESALRPSATIPAPATLASMDQSVNMVRQLFPWYYCGHGSCARDDAKKETMLETPVSKGLSSVFSTVCLPGPLKLLLDTHSGLITLFLDRTFA